MIASMVLSSIAKLLNSYLNCDPEMQGRLAAYQERVLRISITTFAWTFYLKIQNNQLELFEEYDGSIDAALKAGIGALVQSALSTKTSINEDIELEGDAAMIQMIVTIFKNVEIDWEECTANYTGDFIAHGIANMMKDINTFHAKIFNTGRVNLKEYLQEEIVVLPHPFAVDDFCNDVDALREAVDRIDAKLKVYEEHVKEI